MNTLQLGLLIGTSVFFAAIYIFLVCAWFGKGLKLLRGYCTSCTNINDGNRKEQKFVSRVYVAKSLATVLILHASVLCVIFKLWIPSMVLFCVMFVVWGLIEFLLIKNKKYVTAKAEISEDKRWQIYLENLMNKGGEITTENVEDNAQEYSEDEEYIEAIDEELTYDEKDEQEDAVETDKDSITQN